MKISKKNYRQIENKFHHKVGPFWYINSDFKNYIPVDDFKLESSNKKVKTDTFSVEFIKDGICYLILTRGYWESEDYFLVETYIKIPPKFIIFSGEGDGQGTPEIFEGNSLNKFRKKLVEERCGGDRWAKGYQLCSADNNLYFDVDRGDQLEIKDIWDYVK
jgi:hypothetical protein